MRSKRKRPEEQVVEITSAPTSRRDEIGAREKRYIISMTIRTVCFILAFFALKISWVIAAILLFASFLLPAISVVVANSASPRIEGSPVDPGFYYRELGAGPGDDPR